MKKLVFLIAVVLMAISCTVQQPMYSWYKYDDKSYKYLKNGEQKDIDDLIVEYENVINNQKGTRNTVPPGISADYGFLLITLGQTDKGKEFLKQEMAIYPESKIIIERILKMLEE